MVPIKKKVKIVFTGLVDTLGQSSSSNIFWNFFFKFCVKSFYFSSAYFNV